MRSFQEFKVNASFPSFPDFHLIFSLVCCCCCIYHLSFGSSTFFISCVRTSIELELCVNVREWLPSESFLYSWWWKEQNAFKSFICAVYDEQNLVKTNYSIMRYLFVHFCMFFFVSTLLLHIAVLLLLFICIFIRHMKCMCWCIKLDAQSYWLTQSNRMLGWIVWICWKTEGKDAITMSVKHHNWSIAPVRSGALFLSDASFEHICSFNIQLEYEIWWETLKNFTEHSKT